MELTIANTGALVLSAGAAIASAAAGLGYWALVIMAVIGSIANTLALWLVTRWLPGRPTRGVDMAGLARFGGTVTTNGVMYYAACNFDKVLLGRVWGGEALGLYGRAYQLINFPAEGIYGAAGEVAFSALSRIQKDAERLRKYFLSGYSLLLSLTIPLTVACGLFADDIVLVALGPKWSEAAPIFRMLAPAMIGLAIVNPLSWLLIALGMVGRSLRMALVISPALVIAFLVGVPYGPLGVAAAYSAVMVVWSLPAVVWAMAGTPVQARDVFIAIARPACASAIGGIAALAVRPLLTDVAALPRLTVETAILFGLFAAALLVGFGQKRMFMELLRPMARQTTDDDRLAQQGSSSV
jgi:PST family polysaccharide transporter